MEVIKINAKNCHTLEPGQLLLWILRGLIDQGVRSTNPDTGACRYRGESEDGKVLKCAAGMCIPDEDYSYQMEGAPVISVLTAGRYFSSRFSSLQIKVLAATQNIHDTKAFKSPLMYWQRAYESLGAMPEDLLHVRIVHNQYFLGNFLFNQAGY